MKLFKKIAKSLIFPNIIIIILLIPFSLFLLIYSFIYHGSDKIVCYVAYIISAYTLTALCARIPSLMRFIDTVRHKNKYLVMLDSDARLRVNLSLYGSLLLNSGYAVFQLGLGFYHRSVWFYTLSAYYLLLAVMRFLLLRYTRTHSPGENRIAELQRYRFCGIILLVMNSVLSVIVFYITWQNRTFSHHQITTIAIAAYTFTTFTFSIINLVKYRRYNSPVFSATKTINLAQALVSMLTLETTMLTAFGDEADEGFRRLMTGSTGSAVLIVIFGMALVMITKAAKELHLTGDVNNG